MTPGHGKDDTGHECAKIRMFPDACEDNRPTPPLTITVDNPAIPADAVSAPEASSPSTTRAGRRADDDNALPHENTTTRPPTKQSRPYNRQGVKRAAHQQSEESTTGTPQAPNEIAPTHPPTKKSKTLERQGTKRKARQQIVHSATGTPPAAKKQRPPYKAGTKRKHDLSADMASRPKKTRLPKNQTTLPVVIHTPATPSPVQSEPDTGLSTPPPERCLIHGIPGGTPACKTMNAA